MGCFDWDTKTLFPKFHLDSSSQLGSAVVPKFSAGHSVVTTVVWSLDAQHGQTKSSGSSKWFWVKQFLNCFRTLEGSIYCWCVIRPSCTVSSEAEGCMQCVSMHWSSAPLSIAPQAQAPVFSVFAVHCAVCGPTPDRHMVCTVWPRTCQGLMHQPLDLPQKS